MATTTRTIRIDLQDQPQAPADTTSRPTVTNEPARRPAPPRRRMPAWSWVALALLAALVIAGVATALHALTTSPAGATTQSVSTSSAASDPKAAPHGNAGRLVDASGAPITLTGSTAVTGTTPVRQKPGLRLHLPGSHVVSRGFVEHTMGFVAGRASM